MSTMLLEGCACAAKMATCSCVHEVATSGIDLEIARLVCDTIVCVLLIFVLGALAWRLIDHHATKKVTIRKRRWDFANKNLALRQDLLEKKLEAIEKGKGEQYVAAVDAGLKAIEELDRKK